MTTDDGRHPDDRALVERARHGDRDALDALLRRHHDRLAALCRRLTGDPADADDALQEALIAIARGIRRFDGRAAFSTWAYRVTTNACFDELRRRRRRPEPIEPDGSGPTAGVADPSPGLDAVPGRLDVEAALARLPEDFRAAVVLRDLCDLDYAQIAAVLDLPPGTVRSRIARGRTRLAALLGHLPAGEGPPVPGAASALGNPPTVSDRPSPRP